MTQKEYENKKRECWEEFKDEVFNGNISYSQFFAFSFAFDRAYALGKQFGNPEQVDIEKVAEKFADEIIIPTSIPGVMIPLLLDIAKSSYLQGAQDFLGKQFGNPEQLNAEGEEILTVSRKRVQEMYTHYDAISSDPDRPKDYIESIYEYADGVTIALDDLFGSKCRPDEEPSSQNSPENCDNGNHISNVCDKLAEPKFKAGDEVVWDKRIIAKVDKILNDGDYIIYSRVGNRHTVHESDLEPYTEPKAGYLHVDGELETSASTFTDKFQSQSKSQSRNYSQNIVNCDKEFDNILKGSFREHNRLNVAAVAMAGILANPNLTNGCGYIEAYREYIATQALYCADELIAECEKYHA